MNVQVLHLIEKLSLGGAGRSLLGLAKYSAQQGFSHTVYSVLPPDPAALTQAQKVGAEVITGDASTFSKLLILADIVQIHFWNAPELYRILQGELPAVRILCWSHISGEFAPQVLTPELLRFCDALAASSTHTAELPIFREYAKKKPSATILDSPDFSEFTVPKSTQDERFTVVYVGTVDFVKMHPDFVSMHAQADIPNLRVLVCGDGPAMPTLKRQAAETSPPNRFEFLGYQKDPAPTLARAQIFGCPLATDNYATSELALQEAMYLGIPPLLLSRAGPARMIEHGVTGYLAKDKSDYTRKLEKLAASPKERAALGKKAARFARENWGAERSAHQMVTLYRQLLKNPKRKRKPLATGPSSRGVTAFLQSLGANAPQFRHSLEGASLHGIAGEKAADRFIAASSAQLASASAGGVLHYRISYPSDPYLRYWSGLILAKQGRNALAAMEFRMALQLGFSPSRLQPHLGNFLAPPNETNNVAARSPKLDNQIDTSLEKRPNVTFKQSFNRLRQGQGSVIFCGNSVTAQKNGYRSHLTQWLQDFLSTEITPYNATLGGGGSFGSSFLLHRTLDRNPTQGGLCFIECLTGDIGNKAKAIDIGADLENSVRRLRSKGYAVCFLTLYHHRIETENAKDLINCYSKIANLYQIPVVDVASDFQQNFSSDFISEQVLLRDRIHTTPTGSYYASSVIGRHLKQLDRAEEQPENSNKEEKLPIRLFDLELPYLSRYELNPGLVDGAIDSQWGRFQLVNRFLRIDPNQKLELSFNEGQLAGLLFIAGPHSGAITATNTQSEIEYNLKDKWCHFERLHVLRFDSKELLHGQVQIGVSDIGLHGSSLQLVSLLLRNKTATPPQPTLRLITL